jgi:predicted  nucleic acid-binding Zn-ribbon protein
MNDTLAVLAAQGREIVRHQKRIAELESERDEKDTLLSGWIDLAEKWQDERDWLAKRSAMAEVSCDDLEAELKQLSDHDQAVCEEMQKYAEECTAIKAKTIEECAQINDAAAETLRLDTKRYSRAGYLALVDAAIQIRALKERLKCATVDS